MSFSHWGFQPTVPPNQGGWQPKSDKLTLLGRSGLDPGSDSWKGGEA